MEADFLMISFRPLLLTALLSTALFAQKNHDLGYDDTPLIPGQKWRVHDDTRKHPVKVRPGAQAGQAPSDAIVLFDGKDLSH